MAKARRPPRPDPATEAAATLRAILAAVQRGEIDADTPQARRLLRRLEGAVGAWEAVKTDEPRIRSP